MSQISFDTNVTRTDKPTLCRACQPDSRIVAFNLHVANDTSVYYAYPVYFSHVNGWSAADPLWTPGEKDDLYYSNRTAKITAS